MERFREIQEGITEYNKHLVGDFYRRVFDAQIRKR